MDSTVSVALSVCTTCRLDPTVVPADGVRDGAKLFAAIEAVHDAHSGITVRGVACMSGCKRACTVALSAPGKPSYLFGDLPPDGASAGEALAVAALYRDHETGLLLRSERPVLFRAGILARIPPLTGTTW